LVKIITLFINAVAVEGKVKISMDTSDFKHVDTFLISDISKDISEFIQFVGITVLFAAILLVSRTEWWNSGILEDWVWKAGKSLFYKKCWTYILW